MRLIPAPYRILALVLLALACAAFGYVQGLARESDRRDAAALRGISAGVAVANKESARREAVGAQREVVRERIRVVYRTIKEKADVYIDTHKSPQIPLRSAPPPFAKGGMGGLVGGSEAEGDFIDCGLDADGLRIWNAANSGGAASLSGEPDYTLHAAAAGSVGQLAGLAAQPHRGDGVVRAMPGSVGEAGGVRER